MLSANTIGPYCICAFSHLEQAKRIEGVKFVETSPNNLLEIGRNGNKKFYRETFVQIAKNPQSLQFHAED